MSPGSQRSRLDRLRIVLLALIAILAALLVWQAVDGGEDSDEAATTAAPRILSPAELSSIAASHPGPLYWAGPRPGAELEYSAEPGGRAFVRYLTGGAGAGDPRAAFLTVGTYRLRDPLEALLANAKRTGTELRSAPRGAFAWVDPNRPTSVYLARPGADHQVEVYDPSPKRALRLALSGAVAPLP